MGEPLDSTPVYRNLVFRSSFFGLTPFDLPLMLVPGGVTFLVSMLVGFSTMWGFIVAATVGASLVTLKWRKPDDYLETLVHVAFAPRRLSHKERDVVVLPFPHSWRLHRAWGRHAGRTSLSLPPPAEPLVPVVPVGGSCSSPPVQSKSKSRSALRSRLKRRSPTPNAGIPRGAP